jgi:hypothetical protein
MNKLIEFLGCLLFAALIVAAGLALGFGLVYLLDPNAL